MGPGQNDTFASESDLSDLTWISVVALLASEDTEDAVAVVAQSQTAVQSARREGFTVDQVALYVKMKLGSDVG